MRYIAPGVEKDLKKKMVFIGGPRQSGKTTLARHLLARGKGSYFNWDADEDRRAILAKKWHPDDSLLVFDELHKYPRWKNWIKGVYDTQGAQHSILLTGSARLDVYRRGGDSLLGRYHYWRLHPFGLDEVPPTMSPAQAFDRLMRVGGFPEPFLDGDEREARRWRKQRMQRVIKDDIRDLEPLRDISTLELFVDSLRFRVGGLVVLAHIAGDLQVAPNTLKHWLEILDRMYVTFTVLPWTRGVPRAVQKPPKVYFYDTGDVQEDVGPRFENFVATQLLKRLHYLEDTEGYRYELRYLRDKEGHEVDFVVVKEGKIVSLIEAKHGDPEISPSLRYFANKLNPLRAIQIVSQLKRPYTQGRLEVTSPTAFFPGFSP